MKNRFLLFFLLLCTLGFAGNRDGLTPHWTGPAAIPTPTGGNMTINVIVYLDGQEVQNPNFELCTFMGDEVSQCLGGWFPQVNPEGHYYYGGNSFGYNDPYYPYLNLLTFKLWDHDGDSLVGTSPYTVLYKDNNALGTPFHPAIVNFYSGETEWVLVEDASTIAEGQELLITNADATQALNCQFKDNNRGAWPISFADNNISWVDPEFTYDEDEEVWTIDANHFTPQIVVPMWIGEAENPCLHAGHGWLYAGSSSSNWLKTGNSINENSYWSITIENGEAEIVAQGSNTRNTIRYNSSSTLFSCYANDNTNLNPVAIYRRQLKQATSDTYYTLTVNVDPADAATAGCTYTASIEPGEQGYAENTQVTLTAVPAEGWTFVKWMDATDITLSTETTYTVTMTANTSVWAVFEPEAVLEPYTVTLEAGSGSCDVSEVTEAAGGAGVTLPAAVPCDAAITAGYTFAGWATAAVAETTTAPELFNGTYHPEANITLYAVYAMGGGMEAANALADGDVVYMATETFGKELSGFGATTMSFGIGVDYTGSPAGLYPLTVVANEDGTYSFTMTDGYLNWASGNNNLGYADAITNNSSWNITFNEDNTVVMSPVAQDEPREIAWNNQSNGNRFATYKSSTVHGNSSDNYGAIKLFVPVEGGTYNSNPACDGTVVPQDPVFVNVPDPITTTSVTVEITCATEGATIYYTVDGTDPTAESTEYTGPFVITETTTVKAIAILGDESSNVVTQVYTFTSYTMFENIAAFKAGYTSETNTTMTDIAMITGDVTFVFRNGRYMYVQDETAGLLIYDNSTPIITNTYNNGDVISGGIVGKWSIYNNQIEMIPTANPAEGVAGTAVEPTVVTAAEVLADYAAYDAKFVKMETVTFNEDHTFNNTNTAGRTTTFTQGEAAYTVFNRFGTLDLTVEEGQEGDVTGFIGIHSDTQQLYPRDNEDIELAGEQPTMVTITVTVDPADAGTVNGSANFTGEFEEGATVTLNATPAEGYVFWEWMEGSTYVDNNPTLTFTATANRDLIAMFKTPDPEPPTTFTITVLENENGTVTADAETAEAGETITVTATANAFYELTSLYYYTTDPEDVTAIDLENMQFEMPAADVFIGAEFVFVADHGDANGDGEFNIIDVLTVLNYILGKDPQPFDFEQADMNGDGVIDISDAMAINAMIHAAKAGCDEMVALYDVVDGMLMIESEYALAGYQFNLSAEPTSTELAGFSTMGNWVNGEYIFLVFNLNNAQESGTYAVLDLGNAQVNNVALATLTGCKVNAEKGTLGVNSLEANFKVYPVPATTTVMVEGEGINFIEVYNVMGQRVMTANTQEVNVSALSAGAYMLRINTNNGVVNKSVIVK